MIEKIYYVPCYYLIFLLLIICMSIGSIIFYISTRKPIYLVSIFILFILMYADWYCIYNYEEEEMNSSTAKKRWEADYNSRVGKHELKTNQLLLDLASKLPPNSFVLDAGAHVGDTGIPLAEKVKNKGITVIEIEPEFSKTEFIRSKAKSKGVNNIKIINSGLWSSKTNAKLIKSKHAGSWYIKEDPKGDIKLDTLDNLTPKLDLIHLDVENSEYQVLLGGKKVINKYKPSIIMEVIDSKKAIELLKSWGYIQKQKMERDQLFVHHSKHNFTAKI